MNTLKNRPAETSALTAAVVVVISHALAIQDPDVLVGLTVIVGAIPAVVTWIVTKFKEGK